MTAATEQQLTRAAISTTPTTADEATRSIELVIASGNAVNGQVLTCTPAAVSWGPAPVPVLLSHENKAGSMAGRLIDIRFDGGQLIGRAQFTDAPAADAGWQLARSGCAVSVGAYFMQADTAMQGTTEVVKRWRLGEASLVPIGADPLALTRSAQSINNLNTSPMNTETAQTELQVEPQEEQQLSRSEANRQLQIERSAAAANLSREETDEILRTTTTTTAGLMEVIRRHAAVTEARAMNAGHPARINVTNDNTGGLEQQITRALAGERLEQPLWLSMRQAGIGHGGDAVSVWRSALAGEGRWLHRNLSTSDLPNLLVSVGDRRLLERFDMADSGVRLAATVRQLVDYRSASVIDVGMIGTAKEIKEGGEITFAAASEAAAQYKPLRFGLGLSWTPQALANDDLSGLDAALAELADSMLDAETAALVDLLEGATLGRNAPDGKALFHADHANTTTGPVTLTTIGAAVARLRKQTNMGGRFVKQEPMAVLCGPDRETDIRQLMSSAITPAQSSNVNPWANLEVAVEPRLSGGFAYILGSGRRALELGRLTPAPQLTSQVDFSTSCFKAKSEHVFGAVIQEHRSIIRIPTA